MITNNDWYTFDGKKLSGETTTKGVYIVKGREKIPLNETKNIVECKVRNAFGLTSLTS